MCSTNLRNNKNNGKIMWALKYSEMNQECHVDAKLAKTKPQTNSSFFNKKP